MGWRTEHASFRWDAAAHDYGHAARPDAASQFERDYGTLGNTLMVFDSALDEGTISRPYIRSGNPQKMANFQHSLHCAVEKYQ